MIKTTEQIWNEYHRMLQAFIQKRVSDASDAEDILQDVFIKIHSGLGRLKEDHKIESWIYQITRNCIIDYYRANKKMQELPESLTSPEKDSEERLRREIGACLLPMILLLPEIYRDAVKASELDGLAQKEVAEKQGISLSGAKSRIQRGRAMLKDMLQECCVFEKDHRGKLVDYRPKGSDGCCENC